MHDTILQTAKNSIQYWYMPLFVGILFIALGIWTLMTPAASFLGLAIFFSIALIISGISEVFLALTSKKEMANWGWTLVMGVMNLAIGYMLFSNPALTAEFLSFYLGFLVLFRSITAVGTALDIKKYGDQGWGTMMFTAILGIVFAIILLRHPLLAGLTVVTWVALAFFAIGAFAVIFSFSLRNLHKLPGKVEKELAL
jgi:uncharacterized membrane protein HdeD (DUF308 family)